VTIGRIGLAATAGVLGGLLLTLAAVEGFMLHGNQVTLNFYTNGTVDLTMDATLLVKSLYLLLLVIFGLGVGLGLLIAHKAEGQ